MTSDDLPHQVLYASDLDTLEYGSGFPRPPKGDPAAATMSASAVTGAASIGAAYAEPLAASDAAAGAKSPGAKQLAKAKAEAKAKAKVEMLEREREAKEVERTQALPIARRFATAGWNLNNLCRLDRCVLAHCNDLVSGMVVPWLYVGMLFSSFCWHVEDHYAHSINYMHWGAPKTWYGVPGSQAEAFERVMRDAVPELVASEQGLLYKMVTMVPPLEAAAAGVDVCHLLQQPGTFVITWPRGYHAGFSHGLNCAESSNFATADWLPWGRQSVESFRTMPGVRRPCFTHELLLSTLARKALVLSAHIAQWVAPELDLLIETEAAALEALSRMGVPSVSWSHTAEASDSVGMTPIDTVAPMDYAMDEDSVATAAAPSADAPAPVGKALGSEAPTEVADVGPAAQCPMCVACEYECFLSTVECRAADGTITYLCPAHALAPPSHASPEAHAALARSLEQGLGAGQVHGRKDHRRGAAMGQQGVEEQRRRGLRESRVGVPGLGRKGVALKPVQELGAPGGDHVELRAVDVGVDETRHQQLAAAVELEPVVARRLGLHRSDPASGVDQQPMRRAPANRRAVRVGQARVGPEVEQVGEDRRGHSCRPTPHRQAAHASPPASSRATSRTCSRNQRTAGEAWVRSCQSW